MLESQIYQLLNSHALPAPRFVSFFLDETPDVDFYPVALKIESPKVVHKSDFGAVIVNISSKEALEEAKSKIKANIAAKGVTLDDNDRFIAVQMVRGEEFFCGLVDDEIFGKTLLFGKGGIFLEIYKDVCYIDIDAGDEEIVKAVKTTKIAKLFEGFRGSKASMQTVVSFIKAVQSFIKANDDITEMDFNPIILTDDKFVIVDSRIKRGDKKSSKPPCRPNRPNFLDNRRVVIVGASTDPSKVGYGVSKNALSFTGELYFVNKKGGELFGRPLYKSIKEIEGDIDTAVITVPNSLVMESINELIVKKVKNVIIISAGFKEIGDYETEDKIALLAKEHNFNVIGPNCLGYFNGTCSLNLSFGAGEVSSGGLALLSQSGAVLSALMDKAYDAGVGFSHIVSMGNMVDLDFAELIEMLQNEPSCRYIAIYAEGIARGKEFLKAIRNCTKPIYLFKTGKSAASKKAAFSHTGNLSGNYEMFKGLLESVGVKIEDNIEALLFNPLNEVDDILIVTNAGGPATILTDYVVDKGKRLYELSNEQMQKLGAVLPINWSNNNPVDIIGDAMSSRYEATLKIVDEMEGVGLVYVLITPQFMTDCLEIAKLMNRPWKKKMIPILLGGHEMEDAKGFLRSNRIMFFKTLQSATSFL